MSGQLFYHSTCQTESIRLSDNCLPSPAPTQEDSEITWPLRADSSQHLDTLKGMSEHKQYSGHEYWHGEVDMASRQLVDTAK